VGLDQQPGIHVQSLTGVGMAFGDYKSLGEAIRVLQVTEVHEDFLEPQPYAISDHFRSSLDSTLQECPVSCSEVAVCENLVYPVLREVQRTYVQDLLIWSHVSWYQGKDLLGIPDYIIAKRSPLSIEVLSTPYAMIMEAKRNDFDAGWGQCLAAMHAARILNGPPERVIYGGVSDGFVWRFGKLEGPHFARHSQPYDLSRLDELFAVLNHLFSLCRQQVLIPAEAA
jgi:hypothetical protein